MLISTTKAALSLCTLLILAVGAFGERHSPWQVRPVERTEPWERRAEPHHFQEIKFEAVKHHQQKQLRDNSEDMCRLKGAGGRVDVNLTARGGGTKWTSPSEGGGTDLRVYRLSQQRERRSWVLLREAPRRAFRWCDTTHLTTVGGFKRKPMRKNILWRFYQEDVAADVKTPRRPKDESNTKHSNYL